MQAQRTGRRRRRSSGVGWVVSVALALLVGGGLIAVLVAFWGT